MLGANEIFMDAFKTDVRPVHSPPGASERGLAGRPDRAPTPTSGYQQSIEEARVGGTQAGRGA